MWKKYSFWAFLKVPSLIEWAKDNPNQLDFPVLPNSFNMAATTTAHSSFLRSHLLACHATGALCDMPKVSCEGNYVLTENVLFSKSVLRLHLRQNAVFVCLIYRKSWPVPIVWMFKEGIRFQQVDSCTYHMDLTETPVFFTSVFCN